jgi:hypothetical protein
LKIAIVVVSIILAWLTYRFIERPIRNGKWNKLKTIIAAIFMGLVGGVGLYISNGGFARLLPGTVSEMVDHDYHATEAYRLGNCFLSPDRDWTHFADCGVTRDKTKKTILIWGDSHAAHLYPGYEAVFGSKYNIIQRTAASCPPILSREQPDNKFCRELNDKTFELIRKENPDIVVLSALWVGYPENDAVVETIHKLREIGIKNIDLVGPDPLWDVKLGLPRILYNYFQKFGNVPRRMVFGLQPNTSASKIRKLAEDENVRYISPYDILCSKEGCLTRVDDDNLNSLVSWDANHFTPVGSIYVVSRFPSKWEH